MEFALPENRDQLLKRSSGFYYIEDIISLRNIPIKFEGAKTAFIKGNGVDIEKHFELFFSILYKFYEVAPATRLAAWNILCKGCESYTNVLGKILMDQIADKSELNKETRQHHLRALKMYVYLIIEMMKSIHNSSMQGNNLMTTPMKGKKQSKAQPTGSMGTAWEIECSHGLQHLLNFIDLDIHRLWEAQLVEDELISLVSNFCYKVMEDASFAKSKPLKMVLFHLLGCINKKHRQSLSCSLKLIQMLQHFEHIAVPMSEAVHLWVETYKCKSIIAEILRELNNIPEKDLMRDATSTKTICQFIVEVSKLLPNEFFSNISLLLHRMEEEPYQMRTSVLSVMGEIVVQCLSKEGLDQKARQTRDQILDILQDHANLDVNAFVRTKATNIFITLVKDRCLPIKKLSEVTELGSSLLMDRSNLVRKSAIQLLEATLRCNPFAATLPMETLQQKLEEAEQKLQQLQDGQGESTQAMQQNQPDSVVTEEEKQNSEVSASSCDNSEVMVEEIDQSPPESTCTESADIEKQKSVITYCSESVKFVKKVQEVVPVLCQLLRSRTSTDVIESIRFFRTAWEFKMGVAVIGITEMLDQIWNEDAKIREAVVCTYQDLYLKQESSFSSSAEGQFTDNLIMLVASTHGPKLSAVEALICEMHNTGDVPSGVVRILWERLVNPSSDFSVAKGIGELKQKKVITNLLEMFAQSCPDIIKPKINLLVEIGLQEFEYTENSRAVFDFELAYNTCRALSKLKQKKVEAGRYQKPFRVADDHPVVTKICDLISDGLLKASKNWIKFALEGIDILFQLAAYPVKIATSLVRRLKSIASPCLQQDPATCDVTKTEILTRLFQVYGHCALKLLVFIDGDVFAELKQRSKLQEEKKQSEKKKQRKKGSKPKAKTPDKHNESIGNLEEEMGVGGSTLDDEDQEFLKNILENEIVAPGTMFGDLTELIVRSSLMTVDPGDLAGVRLQQSATLALAKYMLVSSKFCDRHLQIFFTLLETSPHEVVRANLILAAGDLCVRFPNLVEPWTSKIYGRLNDASHEVRMHSIKVLTSLILNDMIKVKGYVSEMAKCTVDENERISMLAKRFFQELAQKGNAVYNIMPDVISRLSDPELGEVDEVDFKAIMRFLFYFIQKDRQSESLVEKLCHRFKATRVVQQWRDLAFCLSLLNFTERGTKVLIKNFQFYRETLRDEQVYCSFNLVLNKCKKSAKPDFQMQIEEFEGNLIDAYNHGVSDEESSAKAAEASKKYKIPVSPSARKSSAARKKPKSLSRSKFDVIDGDEGNDVEATQSRGGGRPVRRRAARRTVVEFSSDDEFDDDLKENMENDLSSPEGDQTITECITRVVTPKRTSKRSLLRA